jgi:ABC-type transporter Mla subunit MlaD
VTDALTQQQLENQLDIMTQQKQNFTAAMNEAENQIETLKQQKHTLVANMNAAEGAIQMLQYLLSQFENGAVQPAALNDEKDTKKHEGK